MSRTAKAEDYVSTFKVRGEDYNPTTLATSPVLRLDADASKRISGRAPGHRIIFDPPIVIREGYELVIAVRKRRKSRRKAKQ